MTMTQIEKRGQVSAHARGFGFAENGEERFFIAPPMMKYLLSQDSITFTVEAGKYPGEYQVGEWLTLEREPRILLGELEVRDGRRWLVSDEPCFVSIEVPGDEPYTEGDVVAVRTAAASRPERVICAELIRVLGPRDRDGFDADYALLKYDLSDRVCAATEKAAREADQAVLERIGQGWSDLRCLPLVTIDGESTRDIDDAVCATRCPAGYQVDVAIADVSAYVRPGSALEAQAFERCTSVYLPGRTVPMLPEAISSELGSLKEGVPRLALVCRMIVDVGGQLLSAHFERAVILSRARLTYSAVWAKMSRQQTLGRGAVVEDSLEALHDLYRVLAQDRRRRGVLDFNDREPKLQVRSDGELEIAWEERNEAHRLIEELMLLANRAAAQMLLHRGAVGFYRHQGQPTQEDWLQLQEWLGERGMRLSQTPSLAELSRLLQAVTDPEAHAILEARIRQVMQNAVYDSVLPQHFSLGFEAYTHYTSPLRRYSDLLVHRLLLGEEISKEVLEATAERCSVKARAARLAERFVWDRIKKRLLVRDVPQGTPLVAQVLYGNRRGLKVLIESWQCMAFIPAENLMGECIRWEEVTQSWCNGRALEPGASLQVQWQALLEEKGSCELIAALR